MSVLMPPYHLQRAFWLSVSFALVTSMPLSAAESTISFDRDIRPILADNCFACHGPDAHQRKAKLRLDSRTGALAELRSGGHAVVPGKPDESLLLERITADNPSRRMPPKKSGKNLTPAQIDLLRRWVGEGATYTVHWAFVPPMRHALPKLRSHAERGNEGWVRNTVDHFILARLELEGLQPSPEANRTTLIRRVTLDLTGLPPTPGEVDAFLADQSPNAYEKVVDRLLRSPRYGEHMARFWLDAARYGDTHGLHLDNYREMWPYRDWVIKAFNDNKPYDRFLTEQLAGDLLPSATLDQIVATGFNRCHVTTSEGGSIEEEVYVRNVVDRVETTGTVFLGLTVGCCRCHDHKFDPIKTKEFYQLFAFFNNLDGPAMDGNKALPAPTVRIPTAEQKTELERVQQEIAAVRKKIDAEIAKVKYDDSADEKETEQAARAEYVWLDDAIPAGAKPSSDGGVSGQWKFVSRPKHPVFSGEKASMRTAEGLSQHFFEGARPGLRVGTGDTLFAYVYLDPANPPKEIMLQWNSGQWLHRAYWGENVIPWGRDNSGERRHIGALPKKGEWVRLEVNAARVGLKPGTVINGWAFTQFGGTVYWDRAGIVTRTPQGKQSFTSLTAWVRAQRAGGGAGLPKDLQQIIKLPRAKRNDAQKKQLREYFLENVYAKVPAALAPLRKQLADLDKKREQIDKLIPATLVFKERAAPKPAYILKRGEYDQRGEQVGRETPKFLPPLPENAPRDRLGLARWLLAPDHPLTARVEVNRLWQQCFGTGLVKTTEDFGTQGESPSHPRLLDWLAVQLREDGWDIKKMMKRLVMSATYRQSSRVTKDRLAKDPQNRLLSRGPRFRLDAEMLRDQALFVSGLLVEKLGGPSVKPPQPSGLWEAVGYTGSNTKRFVPDHGHEKVHRRSMYTFWKRTAPPPEMNTFDAPSRESCLVRRERTNTPLQALMMMNDPQFVEAARALAERTMKEGGATPETRLAYMFRLTTGRRPDAKERAELLAAYKDHLAAYTRDAAKAKQLISVGELKPDEKLNASELAAWTMIANLLLNLDEVINKG
ncbi:MAG TPA: PSD1 and planctomycete cytochrome C domain-containing protein [Gemmataceae bacterium]|nr:PSD1 and planctomycete cytochrome C domain-containing protein [Gemmataceae bacterium]